MPFSDTISARSRRQFREAHLRRILGEVRSGNYVHGDDPLQDTVEERVADWKNAQFLHGPESAQADEARDTLLGLLDQIEEIYLAPAKDLEQRLVEHGLDAHLEGASPSYPGEFTVHQRIDQRGRYVETREIPGYEARSRVLLSATDVQKLEGLRKAVRDAELRKESSRAAGDHQKIAAATERQAAAEAALDEFLQARGVALPSSQPQQDDALIEQRES